MPSTPPLRIAIALLLLCPLPLAAQAGLSPGNGGTGIDGAFNPPSSTTLNTDVQSVYEFTTMNINPGVTVTVTGSQPVVFKVQGPATIGGVLNCSGTAGGPSGNNAVGGLGGNGGPGGGAGGNGGCAPPNFGQGIGMPGTGRSPGQPGNDLGPVPGTFTDPVGGGGGGGNATAGMPGALPNAGGGASLSGNGGPVYFPHRAGSGGGGGGCDIDDLVNTAANDGGGAGGGGGGRVTILSEVSIDITGSILANGGNGGASSGNGGGGGGGSGGLVELAAPFVTNNGMIRAIGGAAGPATQTNCGCSAGGTGGNGAIFIFGGHSGGGTEVPSAQVFDEGLVLTDRVPFGGINMLGIPSDTYYAAISGSTGPPLPLGGGLFFDLNIADPLFQLTFPVNLIPTYVSGLTGSPGMVIAVNLSLLPADSEATVYAQAITASSVITGSSNVLPVFIRL